MKRITLFILVITLNLISCNKDEDISPSSDKIIGVWRSYQAIEDGELYEYDIEGSYTTEYTFKSDGTYDVWWDIIGWGGIWKNIGNGKYKFGEISINEYLIEFIDDNEFIKTHTDDEGWIEYYIRIE